MIERWAEVAGWPGYRISTSGTLLGKRGGPLAGFQDKNGYRCAYLGPRLRGASIKVHRLVAAAFIGPIPEGMQVNHINGVKSDNRLENLEIVTPAENIRHSFQKLGRVGANTNPAKGVSHHNARLTADEVKDIRRLYAAGIKQVTLAERFNTPQTNVSSIVRRKAWAHVD